MSDNEPVLTARQQEIFEFIKDQILTTGMPPTVREIGSQFNIASPNGVQAHVTALIKKGFVSRTKTKSRGLVPVVPDGHCKSCGQLLPDPG